MISPEQNQGCYSKYRLSAKETVKAEPIHQHDPIEMPHDRSSPNTNHLASIGMTFSVQLFSPERTNDCQAGVL